MNPSKIVVIGSSNLDMVVQTKHIPVPGETILSDSFFMNPGGKGANQAVTIARLGREVIFISKLGNDIFGKQFHQVFAKENINTDYLIPDDDLPSGVALITVGKNGENSIVVAPGANGNLKVEDLEKALPILDEAGIILMQLEIPLDVVNYVGKYVSEEEAILVLNPAPARVLPDELLKRVNILTPNETEASILSGIPINNLEDAKKSAQIISQKGVDKVIITMGAQGVLIYNEESFEYVEAQKVNAVDTTAAGDVFNGALCVALAEGNSLSNAVRFASVVAAISVTKKGAQSSIPYRNEIFLKRSDIK